MAFYDPEVFMRLEPYIQDKMKMLSEKMVLGGCKTWESYVEAVGRYGAYSDVIKEANAKSIPPDDITTEDEEE